MKIRIKFSKEGPVKFIGHLDIMRYFQKAVRRAQIDVAYSSGFSPHQIMSFAAPLGVGLESRGEYFDMEIHSMKSCLDLKECLNAAMTEGIRILNATLLPENAGNAMATVAAAEYLIEFRAGCEPKFDWKNQFTIFNSKENMIVIKQTKKSVKELDLKPFIYSMEAVENGIRMTVDASSSGNVKPSLVMEAFYKESGQTAGDYDWKITRLETYRNAGTEAERKLVSLDDTSNF